MKVSITTRNYSANDNLKETIDKKMQKLDKYFSSEIVANVMLTSERGRSKVEATINARGMIFRAEESSTDIYESVDRVVDKLSGQMSRFKTKLQKKNVEKVLDFESIPEYEEEPFETKLVKIKKFELEPMSAEDAIVRMELLQHNFFVFLNMETDSVNVVYKRKENDYGLLETTY